MSNEAKTKAEDYYEVPGIDLEGNETTFKILISKPQEGSKEHEIHDDRPSHRREC